MIGKGQKGQVLMIASVFELYGALCFLSLIAFLVLAARAKLRPDLDEDEFDIGEIANPGSSSTLFRSRTRPSRYCHDRPRPARSRMASI